MTVHVQYGSWSVRTKSQLQPRRGESQKDFVAKTHLYFIPNRLLCFMLLLPCEPTTYYNCHNIHDVCTYCVEYISYLLIYLLLYLSI